MFLIFGREINDTLIKEIIARKDTDESLIIIIGEVKKLSYIRMLDDFDIVNVQGKSPLVQGELNSLEGVVIFSNYDLDMIKDLLKDITLTTFHLKIRQYGEKSDIIDLTKIISKKHNGNKVIVKYLGLKNRSEILDTPNRNLRLLVDSCDKIKLESKGADVVYWDFDNIELIPSNRGIQPSVIEGYTHVCGLESSGFDCIEKRFIRGNTFNINKVLVQSKDVMDIEFSQHIYNSIYLDYNLTEMIVLPSGIMSCIREWINLEEVSYVYVNNKDDKNYLNKLGVPKKYIKIWEEIK